MSTKIKCLSNQMLSMTESGNSKVSSKLNSSNWSNANSHIKAESSIYKGKSMTLSTLPPKPQQLISVLDNFRHSNVKNHLKTNRKNN